MRCAMTSGNASKTYCRDERSRCWVTAVVQSVVRGSCAVPISGRNSQAWVTGTIWRLASWCILAQRRWSKSGVWEGMFEHELPRMPTRNTPGIDSTIGRSYWTQQRGIEYQDSCDRVNVRSQSVGVSSHPRTSLRSQFRLHSWGIEMMGRYSKARNLYWTSHSPNPSHAAISDKHRHCKFWVSLLAIQWAM